MTIMGRRCEMKPTIQRLSISLREDLVKALKAIARRENRSVSNLIETRMMESIEGEVEK